MKGSELFSVFGTVFSHEPPLQIMLSLVLSSRTSALLVLNELTEATVNSFTSEYGQLQVNSDNFTSVSSSFLLFDKVFRKARGFFPSLPRKSLKQERESHEASLCLPPASLALFSLAGFS